MSHLKRNLILEQKSPLNSLAYSSINWSKTFSFTAEYSFIRHKWTLYYRNAPPPESGNLQVGMGIRKNTASWGDYFWQPRAYFVFHRILLFCTNRIFCYSKTSNLTWITIFKYTVSKMKWILVLKVKKVHRTNGLFSSKINTWTYCMFNNNLNYTSHGIT